MRALHAKQYVDGFMRPVYQKKLPVMRNALLALSLRKKSTYTTKIKSDFWEQGRGTLPAQLFTTFIEYDGGLEREHTTVILMTRERFPGFPSIPIHLNDGRTVLASTWTGLEPVPLNASEINALSAFTFKVFQDVFGKTFEPEPEQLSYWLAPSAADSSGTIDWDLIANVLAHEDEAWSPKTSSESLVHRFLIDRSLEDAKSILAILPVI